MSATFTIPDASVGMKPEVQIPGMKKRKAEEVGEDG
jgi:hypothetical protein